MTSLVLPSSTRRRVLAGLLVACVAFEAATGAALLAATTIGERTQVGFVALYLPRHPLLAAACCATVLALVLRRRALAALQGILLVVVLVPVMGLRVRAPERVAGASGRPIRVTSYNVFFGKYGREKVLDEIARDDADIVVVQAAWRSMGDRLRERFPQRVVHRDGELVLVSRFPVRDVEVPDPLPDGTPAMYVGYELVTPQGPLRVYNVHPFSPRHALRDGSQIDENRGQREAQIRAAVTAARSPGPPTLVAGDTNLPGLSAIGRRHLGGLRDAFDEVGSGFGYTFPARVPWMRIDRVLAVDAPAIRFAEVRVARRGASDHRALHVVLTLDP